jgi:hypothetical protein
VVVQPAIRMSSRGARTIRDMVNLGDDRWGARRLWTAPAGAEGGKKSGARRIGGVTPPLPHLVLYTRPGCHLCDEAREAIEAVLADRAARSLPVPPLTEQNIDEDDDLQRRYLERIPVVELDGRRVELIVSIGKVRRLLGEALDG